MAGKSMQKVEVHSNSPHRMSHDHSAYTPPLTPFGKLVPFGDPLWYQGWHTPYYNQSHVKLRKFVRDWVEEHVVPFCHEWDEEKSIPRELFHAFAKSGLINLMVLHVTKPEDLVYPLPCGLTRETTDVFHELIVVDEFCRCGSGGATWALFGGLGIGLPPVLSFAEGKLRERVVRPCLSGEKIICLAVTEPTAGSDVAQLKCTAVLNKEKTHYIINGVKKWITNGVYADFFTVLARTGEPDSGMMGLSMFVVEKGMKGVSPRQMKCSGVWPSGTALISFDNVTVPVENMIGDENMGFKYAMVNFNNERMGICAQANRFARVCLEEAMEHAHRRETFGKKLIDHPVIRFKMAHMARQVESTHALIEFTAYQFKMMADDEKLDKMPGLISLLKVQTTMTFEYCAREAAQILGGLAYTRGGLGEKVERLYREVRAYAIPGGSEEIMCDVGMKMAIKSIKDLRRALKEQAENSKPASKL